MRQNCTTALSKRERALADHDRLWVPCDPAAPDLALYQDAIRAAEERFDSVSLYAEAQEQAAMAAARQLREFDAERKAELAAADENDLPALRAYEKKLPSRKRLELALAEAQRAHDAALSNRDAAGTGIERAEASLAWAQEVAELEARKLSTAEDFDRQRTELEARRAAAMATLDQERAGLERKAATLYPPPMTSTEGTRRAARADLLQEVLVARARLRTYLEPAECELFDRKTAALES